MVVEKVVLSGVREVWAVLTPRLFTLWKETYFRSISKRNWTSSDRGNLGVYRAKGATVRGESHTGLLRDVPDMLVLYAKYFTAREIHRVW